MEKRLMMFLVSLFLSMGIATAQTQVSGTVISSEDNEPIIGASIIVQGSKAGTVTDSDGKFSLTVPKGKKMVVSYIGMQPQTLNPKANMRVVLTPQQCDIERGCGNRCLEHGPPNVHRCSRSD